MNIICLGVAIRCGASLIAQLVKNLPAMQETPVWFLGWEDPLERDRLPTTVFLGFPCGSAGKESAYNVGDLGSIPELRRTTGEGNGYPLQYSGLENSMEGTVHGITELDMTGRLSLSLSLGVDIFVTYVAWYSELPGSVVWYLSFTGKILPSKSSNIFFCSFFSFFFWYSNYTLHFL